MGDRGTAVAGSGSEAISLNRVFRLTGTSKASVIRAPARPASLRPTDTSVDRSRSVHRPNLRVRPGTCSTKVMRSAGFLLADEPRHPQRHHDDLARRRQITRRSQVGVVYSPRPAPTPAPRNDRPSCGRAGLDPHDRVDHLDRFHQHALDRGKHQLVQLRQHFVHGEGLSTTPPSSQAILGRTSVVVDGQCAHDWLAANEPGSTHQAPLGSDHPGNREALYRRTAEISPPGRSSRCGGVLIGRP